jgi:hypothetical protein
VRIDGPVNEINYFVLNLYYTYTLRIEVIGHVLITSDIHKSTIHSKKRVQERSFLEVSPKVLPTKLCHLINYYKRTQLKMNIFRFIADMLHLAAILLLLYRIKNTRNCVGKFYQYKSVPETLMSHHELLLTLMYRHIMQNPRNIPNRVLCALP